MGRVIAIFQGTEVESADLAAIIHKNCTCASRSGCASHEAIKDQGTLDRLLFNRRTFQRLWDEEWCRYERRAVEYRE